MAQQNTRTKTSSEEGRRIQLLRQPCETYTRLRVDTIVLTITRYQMNFHAMIAIYLNSGKGEIKDILQQKENVSKCRFYCYVHQLTCQNKF